MFCSAVQNITLLITVQDLGPGASVSAREQFLYSHLNALHIQFRSIGRFGMLVDSIVALQCTVIFYPGQGTTFSKSIF